MTNWVDLPKDVLERIFNSCLIPDQIRMQSVCKSWRSILMYGIPRELPWLLTLPNNNNRNSNKEQQEEEVENPTPDARLFYRLSEQEIHTTRLKINPDKGKSKVTDDIDHAQWSDGMRKCLIDICLEQVKSGGRPGVQFSSKAWKMIIEKFTQRTRHSFNQKQLKNQLDNLKELYNAWLHLTSQTGIGFNPHTGCVEMEQDRWTEYLKTHKDAKVFKSKPLPFPEEMTALFDGTLARGDDKWAPTMDGVPEDIMTDNLTNSRSSTLPKDSTASDIASDVMMANIRRKRPRPSKKQLIASNDAVNACIIALAASVKASNQLAIASVQSEGPTIDDCIDVLHAMPKISEGSPLYLIALTCFMVKDKRTIWMRFRTDEGKMAWLKNQLQLEKGNASGSDCGL